MRNKSAKRNLRAGAEITIGDTRGVVAQASIPGAGGYIQFRLHGETKWRAIHCDEKIKIH
jgi:hypothetical protein